MTLKFVVASAAAQNNNAGANLMFSSAQHLNVANRFREISRFADHFAIKRDQRVGGEHDRIAVLARNFERFARSIQSRQLAHTQRAAFAFGAARTHDFKFETSVGQKLAATWRTGSQNQFRAGPFTKKNLAGFGVRASLAGRAGVA